MCINVLCVTEIKYEMVMCKCEHDPHTTDTIEIAWKNGSLVIFYRAWKQELSQSLTNSHEGEKQINGQTPIMLQSQPLEEAESFFYLGSKIGQSRKAVKEVSMRQWLTKYT